MKEQRRRGQQQQQQPLRLVVRLHREIFDAPRLPCFAAVTGSGAACKYVRATSEPEGGNSAAARAAAAGSQHIGAAAAASAFAAAARRETMLVSTAAAAVAGAAALTRQRDTEKNRLLLLNKYKESASSARDALSGTAAQAPAGEMKKSAASEKRRSTRRSEVYQRQLQQLQAAAAADETALLQLLHSEEEQIRQIKVRKAEEERQRQEEEQQRRRQQEEEERRQRQEREAAAAAAAAALREKQQQAPEKEQQRRLKEEEARLRKQQEEEKEEQRRRAEEQQKEEQRRLQQLLQQQQQAQRQRQAAEEEEARQRQQREEQQRREEKETQQQHQQEQETQRHLQQELQQEQQQEEQQQQGEPQVSEGKLKSLEEAAETQVETASPAAVSATSILPALDPAKPETAYVRDVLLLLAEERRLRETQLHQLAGVAQEHVKALRISIKKQINTALNQLASTTSQVIRTCEGIRQYMRSLKVHPAEVSQYFMTQACERLLQLTEKGGQVSTRPSSVWAYAFLVRGLIQEDERVERMFRAHVYATCCYAAPVYYRKKQGVSVEEFRATRGQREGEDEEAFFSRMAACLRLWLSFLIASHKEEEAWSWLARFLNLNLATAKAARRVCACAMVEGLKIAGPALLTTYGRQFKKVMDLIQNSLMPLLLAMQQKNEGTCISMYVTQLRTLVADYYGNNCTLPEPEGKTMKMEATEASPDV